MSRAKYRFVFFDVDSTLVTIEGIDVLAGGNPEIVALTEAAMNGEIPLDAVYGKRLEIIQPSRAAVEDLGRSYIASMVDGAPEMIAALRAAGADIHLVTAGLEPAITQLATHLGLAPRAVHAVGIDFDEKGRYAGFDRRSFLTQPGGKELVVRSIMSRSKGRSAFIGDGVSDLETKPVVDLFVGFGGVHTRETVKQNADVWVGEPTLSAVLPYLLEED